MKNNWLTQLVSYLSLFSLFLFFSPIEVQATTHDHVAVSIVMDTSQSMNEAGRAALQQEAFSFILNNLNEKDHVGFVSFNGEAVEQFEMQAVRSAENLKRLKTNRFDNIDNEGKTNYLAAIEMAHAQLSEMTMPGVLKVVLLLTDGDAGIETGKQAFTIETAQEKGEILAADQIRVYAVGFADEPSAETKTIVEMTNGKLERVNTAHQMRITWFEWINTLQQKEEIKKFVQNTQAQESVSIDLGSNQRETAILFASENPNFTVTPKLNADTVPLGKLFDQVQTPEYTLFKLKPESYLSQGRWTFDIKGETAVNVLAYTAPNLTLEVVSPRTQQQYNRLDNIPFEVHITGDIPEGAIVEAALVKNGKDVVKTQLYGNEVQQFTGEIDQDYLTGNHVTEVRVLFEDEVIAKQETRISISSLPIIKTDFPSSLSNFKYGEDIIVSTRLQYNGTIVKKSETIGIDSVRLYLHHEDGTTSMVQLSDDGLRNHGDIHQADGIYTGYVNLVKSGTVEAVMEASGQMNGKPFSIEKEVSTFQVNHSNNIRPFVTVDSIHGVPGSTVNLPIAFENKSYENEILYISIDSGFGTVLNESIQVPANGTWKEEITIQLNEDLAKGSMNIPVRIRSESELIQLSQSTLSFELRANNRLQEWGRMGSIWILNNRSWIVFVLAVPLVLIFIGYLLHAVLVHPKTLVTGRLEYFSRYKGQVGTTKQLDVGRLRKKKVIISFDEEDKEADFIIPETTSQYQIILHRSYEDGRWKFWDGYRALVKQLPLSDVILRTTRPGIFRLGSEIYTSSELHDLETFTTGSFVFHYYAESTDIQERDEGVDLLSER
ncbi:VWA domain-containing protein [Lacticigenium naphthae]|uniref:VWA domain-containing protein n=1 Tax=Lacticigenium naphthae TaxID=515351 RepID=UPI00040BDE75|nr:VWA domain-containing protein [Lacticigenium naphthae]